MKNLFNGQNGQKAQEKQIISIDLGSNTIRFLKFDLANGRIAEYEKIVRTAEGLQENEEIGQKAIDNIICAIKEAKNRIEDFSKTKIKSVATAAFRRAKNGQKVLEYLKQTCGIDFEIISGEEEARFTLLAVNEALKRLKIENKKIILMDLGGGSTEIVVQNLEIGKILSKSFDFGILSYASKYKTLQEQEFGLDKEFAQMKIFAQEIGMQNIIDQDFIFVATAGTPTTIASFILGIEYENYDYKKVEGQILNLKQIKIALENLLNLEDKERERWVGVGREDLIVCGVLLFMKILETFNFDNCRVVDDGVREGVAIHWLNMPNI